MPTEKEVPAVVNNVPLFGLDLDRVDLDGTSFKLYYLNQYFPWSVGEFLDGTVDDLVVGSVETGNHYFPFPMPLWGMVFSRYPDLGAKLLPMFGAHQVRNIVSNYLPADLPSGADPDLIMDHAFSVFYGRAVFDVMHDYICPEESSEMWCTSGRRQTSRESGCTSGGSNTSDRCRIPDVSHTEAAAEVERFRAYLHTQFPDLAKEAMRHWLARMERYGLLLELKGTLSNEELARGFFADRDLLRLYFRRHFNERWFGAMNSRFERLHDRGRDIENILEWRSLIIMNCQKLFRRQADYRVRCHLPDTIEIYRLRGLLPLLYLTVGWERYAVLARLPDVTSRGSIVNQLPLPAACMVQTYEESMKMCRQVEPDEAFVLNNIRRALIRLHHLYDFPLRKM